MLNWLAAIKQRSIAHASSVRRTMPTGKAVQDCTSSCQGTTSGLLVHWPETAFWEMAPPCTCRESPCDQENTRCWKMTVARGSEMKAQIEPLVETDCR